MVRQKRIDLLKKCVFSQRNKRFRTNPQSRYSVSQLCALVWLLTRAIPENSPLALMPLYERGMSVYPLVKRMVMLHSVPGRSGGEENLLTLPGIEFHFLDYTVCCVVLIHNTLSGSQI